MSSILIEIGKVGPELRALDFTKLLYCILPCLHSKIHTSEVILIKLCHNVYGYKISDEFDYGLDQTCMSRVICP